MDLVKPQGRDLEKLQAAAKLLKEANKFFAIAKKNSESAKAAISEWLKANRQLDIETLKIGEMVMVESVCLIEIGSQNKFDEKAFLLAEPELHQKFKKDFSFTKFKSLV